ncbi:class I SAM-dependent rRNA methyltransferase [Fuerstiella marisgermanici]|uniref:Ribosomal RNA large subunit methyltransferase I n=1 Tax=Fuerstiella marisgermanici TaxID=1891926 RepID=A0A1P8WN07_9PLAN|nr:class I SAM-dependent rRNA methyltransferase [Fuerstiella marisgermanici]APZ95417.1 Ribosomal RNA large subunit methyltransferase I [Fuerstiella marisgermanici]
MKKQHRSAPRRNAPPRGARSEAPRFNESPGGNLDQITQLAPDPTAPIPAVVLKHRISQTAVFRKQIDSVDGARAGDLVAVYSKTKQLIGYGLYNSRSEMALRMLWRSSELPTDASWDEKLQSAVRLRRDVLKVDADTDTYRVIHAEADGMPGLMIDRFGDVLSAEAFSLGMYRRATALLDRLAGQLGTQHQIIQTSPHFQAQEGFDPPTITSPDCPSEVVVQEFGTRFKVKFEGGHKTGFFCDQRENRKKLASFCEGKSVLDLCCYTGGFSVQAMALGKAKEVIGVDLDEAPLQVAKENANLNQVRARFVQSDAFNYMRDMIAAGKQFDVVVLDPPKLIRTRMEIEEGTRKHFDLNRLAMRLVKPGGLLLSCTCSGLLPDSEFVNLLCTAARQSGPEITPARDGKSARHAAREMQIIAKTGAAPCHPVGSNCLETEYLKAVWMIMSE